MLGKLTFCLIYQQESGKIPMIGDCRMVSEGAISKFDKIPMRHKAYFDASCLTFEMPVEKLKFLVEIFWKGDCQCCVQSF